MRKRRSYGKTQDGSWVNLGYVNTLVSMGMDEVVSAEALRQSNNDINGAIEAIQMSPELLVQSITDTKHDNYDVTESMINVVMEMGFPDKEEVKNVLTSV